MSSLADRVIEANNAEPESSEVERVDDIGFPYPKIESERTWCDYLTARLLYLNNRIYKHKGLLWIGAYHIEETKQSYYRLAKYPKRISDPENQYIWRKAKELAPELDVDVLSATPNLVFDMRTGEITDEKVWTTSPWPGKE